MSEAQRLRELSLDALAEEMAGVVEGSAYWSKYVAEFQRRQTAAQISAATTARWSLGIAAAAIVAGSAATIAAAILGQG